jgi:hypothetical protein
MRRMIGRFAGRPFVAILAITLGLVNGALAQTETKRGANLSALPLAAQSNISAALGRDTSGYHAQGTSSGFTTTNPNQMLTTDFTSEGVEVHNGRMRWGMNLRSYGYRDALNVVNAVAPQASANRVEYRRGSLTEWYVTGRGAWSRDSRLNGEAE